MGSEKDFVIDNGNLGKYSGPGGDAVIPEGVTGIGGCAFKNCDLRTSVIIPQGVTGIGDEAFRGCGN